MMWYCTTLLALLVLKLLALKYFYDEEDENMYYAVMARHDVVLNLPALLVQNYTY